MLSKEFLKEAPQINPATGDPYTAAERDAEYEKNKAQGQKNLQGIKDFGSKIGQGIQNFFNPGTGPAQTQYQADANKARVKAALPNNMSMDDFNKARDASEPEEAPAAAPAAAPAPASNPEAELDPAIMRARYDQEAAARKAAPADAAPPPPGGEVRPVPSSTIQTTPLPAPKAFSEPAAAAGAAPAPMKGGYGSGMNNPSVAPKTAAAATDDGPEQLGYSPDELERIQKNAGLPKTTKAINPETGEEYDKLATDAPKTTKAINPETGEEYDKLATDDEPEQLGSSPDELERMQKNAGLATAQSAAGDAPAANPMSQDPAQRATTAANAEAEKIKALQAQNDAGGMDDEIPTAAAAAPAPAAKALVEPEPAAAAPAAAAPAAAAPAAAAPAAVGQTAASMAGAMRSTGQAAPKPAAKSNPAVLKQQQDLIAKGAKIKADGIMGPATQAAIKQFAAAPAASRSAAPAAGAGRGFVNPTAADTKAAVAAAKPAAPVKPAVKESQEISRMRFLAGLTKD